MMKKYVLFLAIGLTLSGNVNATTHAEFETFLDEAQIHYPILKKARIEPNFNKSIQVLLEKSPEKTSEEILLSCINENIRNYISMMGKSNFYFELVEELDPVYRDLNPSCGTNGNGYPVKGIFSRRWAQ